MEDMSEFIDIFYTECTELLTEMEEHLLTLQEGEQDSEKLNAIFRCAHSIKGGAGTFGMDKIMHFTHTLEALLDKMREGKVTASQEVIDALLKSVDIVTQMLDAVRAGKDLGDDYGSDVAALLKRSAEQGGNAPSASPATEGDAATEEGPTIGSYRITFAPHPELFESGNEPILILRQLGRLGEMETMVDVGALPSFKEMEPTKSYLNWTCTLNGDVSEEDIHDIFEFVTDLADISIEQVACAMPETPVETAPQVTEAASEKVTAPEAPAKETSTGGARPKVAASIRVDLDKIDRLVNMVGELVITEAMMRAKVRKLPSEHYASMLSDVDEFSHHTRELQEAIMAVRMQPVKSIFSRMPRIVHDTSSQLGKKIQLVMDGENTEVDKTVIEQLGDPLTHMIRNSVDHGIESPQKRVENGKDEQGTIYLSAYHQSGRIYIQIRDDGNGINREKVREKAIEKGVITEEANLSDEEIDYLIFHPGFSTAAEVTSVSGRGVGMDVVKRNIESIGGSVTVENMPGKGSVFTVTLPLTLAILDGMIVRVGAENYIIPITSIVETMRPGKDEVKRVQGKSDVLNVRGEFIPLIYLHRAFGIRDAMGDPSQALVVLVESGHHKMGVVVDELVGQQQVVIKSLEANADPVKGVSSATILGDGRVALILEINELRELSGAHASSVSTEAA